jgi:hypothetical protein
VQQVGRAGNTSAWPRGRRCSKKRGSARRSTSGLSLTMVLSGRSTGQTLHHRPQVLVLARARGSTISSRRPWQQQRPRQPDQLLHRHLPGYPLLRFWPPLPHQPKIPSPEPEHSGTTPHSSPPHPPRPRDPPRPPLDLSPRLLRPQPLLASHLRRGHHSPQWTHSTLTRSTRLRVKPGRTPTRIRVRAGGTGRAG